MDEVHYLISDASRKVDVEAHVLRYWRKNWNLRSRGMKWGTDIIQIFISGYLSKLRI